MKKNAARAALEHVPAGSIVGVGTGSTANHFIAALSSIKPKGAVASSEATAQRLKAVGIEVLDLSAVDEIPVYVDGADEVTRRLKMIKGGGGALTREKIVAAAAQRFICIADESKLVDVLGKFPLPVEVIPMARKFVSRQLARLGGEPRWREGFVTDNGNIVLDVLGLDIHNPIELESEIDHVAGVVANGLFARRGADLLLLGTAEGVKTLP